MSRIGGSGGGEREREREGSLGPIGAGCETEGGEGAGTRWEG